MYSLSDHCFAMKDPSLCRRKRPKLKLIVSFNGKFQRRPPSGELRYTGGDTRIISVDRNIGFSRLKSKIFDILCCSSDGNSNKNNPNPSFSLKYLLPVPDSESLYEDTLVSITSDDDVRCMIDEYENLDIYGKYTRLWIFVFNDDNGLVSRNTTNSLNDVENENLNDGLGALCKYNGFDGDKRESISRRGSEVFGGDNGFEGRDPISHLRNGQSDCEKLGNSVMGVTRVRAAGDDSLRKLVLKQQLLAKQSGQVQSFHGSSGPVFEQNVMDINDENKNYVHPLMDSKPESPCSSVTTYPNSVENTLDYKYASSNFVKSENFDGLGSWLVTSSRPSSPTNGNLRKESGRFCPSGQSSSGLGDGGGPSSGIPSDLIGAVNFSESSCNSKMNKMMIGYDARYDYMGVEPGLLSIRDRENIMPLGVHCNTGKSRLSPSSCGDQLVRNVYPMKSSYGSDKVWGGFHCGIRNHRFGSNDSRSQRACPYYIRNHRCNPTDMENHWNARLDGRPWVGKYYPGLKSSSNISKQEQAVRSCYPPPSKPWTGSHHQKLDEAARVGDYVPDCQTWLFSLPYDGQENIRKVGGSEFSQYAKPKPKDCHLAYHAVSNDSPDQSCLSVDAIEDQLLCTKSVGTKVDLLTGPTTEKHEFPCQTLSRSLLMDQCEISNISGFPNNIADYNNGVELGCSNKAACKSFGNHQNGVHTAEVGIASSVKLSLHNLSLLSSKEVESLVPSSPGNSDITEALLKHQSKPLDLMDGEHFSSGPRVEKSSGVASNSFSSKAAEMKKCTGEKNETLQDPQSRLTTDEKDNDNKADKCSKVNGGIPPDLAAFYTHLTSRELQTIKNSDLEYIKELGSGAYGTVFYGKWKGSDVAIKRIRPSCFTDGAAEKDRLVADFWKEAHTLGQLHHPNIVALYGVVTDGPVTNLATVTEFMVNGSLNQVLQRKDRTIDRRKRVIIAMDAAFGMEYLHEKNIVHFDLKSHNFLVNIRDPHRPVCKIGDLGLSKIKQRTLISGGVRGTIPWMAPELLHSKNMVTEKVDVFSFGVVMWELLTGEEPYANMRSQEIIAGIIEGTLRPEIPSWCDPAWRSLMERCWSPDADARPSFSVIARELRAMAAAMNIK